MAGDSQSNLLAAPSGPPNASLLDHCDRLLQEIGRRQHRFSWLRAGGDWLPVDAYYPSRRLVVVVRGEDSRHEMLFEEAVPAHGLKLLWLSPEDLGPDPVPSLAAAIAALELAPQRVPLSPDAESSAAHEGAMSRMSASLAQAAAPPAHQRVRRRVVPAASDPQPPSLALGVAVGVALAVAVGIEILVGVGGYALNGRHWLLAFGLALDACARALGTVTAGRAGQPEWAWWSLIGGSPVVAAFTLFGRDGRIEVEPGPIAGLISVVAMSLIAFAIVLSLLGI